MRPRRLPRQEWWLGVVGVLLAFGACEGLSRAGIVRRDYLPPASDVLARAVRLAGEEAFLDGVGATLRAWVLGLALACALAIPLGLLLGSVPVVDAAVRAIVEFLRPLPSVALIPLVSLLLGAGMETEVALVTYASVWPILFNTVYGLGEVDPLAKDSLRVFGFGRLAVLLRVELPGTAPFIAAGIRISAAVALILAVATEILSGFGTGLGIFIAQAELATNGTLDVLAGVVWAGALGLVINGVLVWGERRLFPWTPEHRTRAAERRSPQVSSGRGPRSGGRGPRSGALGHASGGPGRRPGGPGHESGGPGDGLGGPGHGSGSPGHGPGAETARGTSPERGAGA